MSRGLRSVSPSGWRLRRCAHGRRRLGLGLVDRLGGQAVGLAAGFRSALVAVVATPNELVIRNFFTTRRISWPEVRSIDRPRPWVNSGRYSGFYNRGNGLRVRLRNGHTRIAGAHTPAGWDPPGFADDVIEDLRRYANRAKRRH